MTAEEIRKHVDAMIDKTFQKLNRIYENNQEGGKTAQVIDGCRLIFPLYRPQTGKNLKIRISEQELRFAFVDVFHRYCDSKGLSWFYSIETPTRENYIFTKKNEDKEEVPRRDEDGQSARFDFVIHDKDLKRICLIEFKALNPDQSDYHKDFEKLIHDMEIDTTVVRYFIQVLKSYNNGTPKNIAKKLKGVNNQKKITEKYKNLFIDTIPKIEYRCYSLEDGSNNNITQKVIKELRAL